MEPQLGSRSRLTCLLFTQPAEGHGRDPHGTHQGQHHRKGQSSAHPRNRAEGPQAGLRSALLLPLFLLQQRTRVLWAPGSHMPPVRASGPTQPTLPSGGLSRGLKGGRGCAIGRWVLPGRAQGARVAGRAQRHPGAHSHPPQGHSAGGRPGRGLSPTPPPPAEAHRIRPSWSSCSGRCCTRAPALPATPRSARNRSPQRASVLAETKSPREEHGHLSRAGPGVLHRAVSPRRAACWPQTPLSAPQESC